MIIDFHTHIFPEKIAAGTIKYLEQVGGISAATDGTLEGLRTSMKEADIDISVILPVVTKPIQFASVNAYAAGINGTDGIVSFGGIHPDTLDYKGELNIIKTLGLRGIKLHPDYQNTFIDDQKYIQIIRYALELELLVSVHAGIDIGLPDVVHCTPQRANHLLEQIADENLGSPKIIFAHTGGYGTWSQVEEFLVGKNVLFDISYSLGHIDNNQLKRIINMHGANKILFASDCPWGGQKQTLEQFFQLQLSKEVEEQILYKNALRLLDL